mgnify:CR=1 FL=1
MSRPAAVVRVAAAAREPALRPVPAALAAIDLGSNSFHMVVARLNRGRLTIVDRMRETVRLGAGVATHGKITAVSTKRALACLRRFGRRLRELEVQSVRVVGTNALRVARNSRTFLEQAQRILGHPVEIVSGAEEARLIYAGVARTHAQDDAHTLVVDIGGGSTEVIVGRGLEPLELESLPLGCVSLSERFFGDGRIDARRMKQACTVARLELEPVRATFRRRGWELAFGSSGTVRALAEAIRELDPQARAVTRDGLEQVLRRAVAAGHVEALDLRCIDAERRPIVPGGIAILAAVLDALRIDELHVAEAAMREGLLHDMVGRANGEDLRERTVRDLQQRHRVDTVHAMRVENTAAGLLAQVRTAWRLEDPGVELLLRWAARLHEIGRDVARTDHHRHGAYLLAHGDMPGFSWGEQRLLACLVGSLGPAPEPSMLEALLPPWDRHAPRLAVLLRLALLINRDRGEASSPDIALTARQRTLTLTAAGLEDQPLLTAALEHERKALEAWPVRLSIEAARPRPAARSARDKRRAERQVE